MRIDGLEEAERDPDVDGEDVQVVRKVAVQDRPEDRTRAQDEDLRRVRVLGAQPERRGVLVVHLVDVLVEDAFVEERVGWGGGVREGGQK